MGIKLMGSSVDLCFTSPTMVKISPNLATLERKFFICKRFEFKCMCRLSVDVPSKNSTQPFLLRFQEEILVSKVIHPPFTVSYYDRFHTHLTTKYDSENRKFVARRHTLRLSQQTQIDSHYFR